MQVVASRSESLYLSAKIGRRVPAGVSKITESALASIPKLGFAVAKRLLGTRRLLYLAARARRAELLEEFFTGDRATVRSGPFAGLRLLRGNSWGDGDSAAKALGCYEADLHPAIESLIERAPPLIINVGCAEGYYAVGLAMRLPKTKVVAFDLDDSAREICAQTAHANGVAGRVEIARRCDRAVLADALAGVTSAALILDCEGCEADLLLPRIDDAVLKCEILVESHDFVRSGMTLDLTDALAPTHKVSAIRQGGRDPHAAGVLSSTSELERWILVDEGRPEPMTWLHAVPANNR